MKLASIVLAGSLAANVAFLAHYLRSKPPSSDANASTAASTGNLGGARTPASPEIKAAPNPDAAQVAAIWQQLRTEDLPALVARLRAAGFPPNVVRSLIAGEVDARFAARRQAIIGEQADSPYWATGTHPMQGMEFKTMAVLVELSAEQKKIMKDLLGPSAETEDPWKLRARFGKLSGEKYDAVTNVMADYAILRTKLLAEIGGFPQRPEDRDRMAFLAKEERADLEKILTPAEMEAYELRSSDTANLLRRELDAFKPTESEFRAIFRATASAEKNYGSYAGNSRENRGKIGEEILARAKEALSPERFEQFRQLTTFSP
jgi:hypothetical protein